MSCMDLSTFYLVVVQFIVFSACRLVPELCYHGSLVGPVAIRVVRDLVASLDEPSAPLAHPVVPEAKEAGRDLVTPAPYVPPAPKGEIRGEPVPPIPPIISSIGDTEKAIWLLTQE
ncbi:hypothetical protein HAX54_006512, partial [Datura stramonium]|nr:hypothetical protein [Datura stramonium]